MKRSLLAIIIVCFIFAPLLVTDAIVESQPDPVKGKEANGKSPEKKVNRDAFSWEGYLLKKLSENTLLFILAVVLYLDKRGIINLRSFLSKGNKGDSSSFISSASKSKDNPYVSMGTFEAFQGKVIFRDTFNEFRNNLDRNIADIKTDMKTLAKEIPKLIEESDYIKREQTGYSKDLQRLQDNYYVIDKKYDSMSRPLGQLVIRHNTRHPEDNIMF